MHEILKKLARRKDLTRQEAEETMTEILNDKSTPAQSAAFLSLLTSKGESVAEITGLAKVMRDYSRHVEVSGDLLDTCGTGGSGLPRINVSTACAFVLAAGGVKIAKQINKTTSGRAGSFDVLEALGAKVELEPEQVAETINQTNLGFIFTPLFHPATKHIAEIRKELGFKTVFNILGTLTNPANVQRQVLGVSDSNSAVNIIQVLRNLGSYRVLVVYGTDGLDEITLTGPTKIWELENGKITNYEITPEQFGWTRATLNSISGGSAAENAKTIMGIFSGQIVDERLQLILINAAAGFLVYGIVNDWMSGIELANEIISSRAARRKLIEYVNLTKKLTGTEQVVTEDNI